MGKDRSFAGVSAIVLGIVADIYEVHPTAVCNIVRDTRFATNPVGFGQPFTLFTNPARTARLREALKNDLFVELQMNKLLEIQTYGDLVDFVVGHMPAVVSVAL